MPTIRGAVSNSALVSIRCDEDHRALLGALRQLSQLGEQCASLSSALANGLAGVSTRIDQEAQSRALTDQAHDGRLSALAVYDSYLSDQSVQTNGTLGAVLERLNTLEAFMASARLWYDLFPIVVRGPAITLHMRACGDVNWMPAPWRTISYECSIYLDPWPSVRGTAVAVLKYVPPVLAYSDTYGGIPFVWRKRINSFGLLNQAYTGSSYWSGTVCATASDVVPIDKIDSDMLIEGVQFDLVFFPSRNY